MTIRPLCESDSMAELTALVRSAYGQLAAMGFRYWGSWQSEDDTHKRCSSGHCLVAEEGGRLVGTVTVKRASIPGENDPDDPDWYRREGVWVVTQFAVSPKLQGGGLGSRLLEAAESYAFASGADEVAIDTAEGAQHLIDFYAKRGYRNVDRVDWSDTNYLSVVMSKRLRPVLTTERLVLRDLRMDDIATIQAYWADPRFQALYPPNLVSPEQCEQIFTKEIAGLAVYPRTGYHWGVVRDGMMIGTMRLTLERAGVGSLGYGLTPDHWGQGIATEAVRETLRYGFEELLLHRVHAWVFENNVASRRVLEKLGFTYEGTLREKVQWGDEWLDDQVFGLLKREWEHSTRAPGRLRST